MSLSLHKAGTHERGLACSGLSWVRALSLDAPLVALTWQALVAKSVGVALRPVHVLSLFVATWLAYSGDRLLDGLRLERSPFVPARHRLAIRHRLALALIWGVIALGGGAYALRTLSPASRSAGLALLGLVALYFAACHAAPTRMRRGLPRELVVSALFSIAVALFPLVEASARMRVQALPPFAALAGAAFMNLWAVACWEREEDAARGEITLVSGRPRLARAFVATSLVLALCALGVATIGGSQSRAAMAFALSLLALAAVHPVELSPDAKPLLADAALLSPLLVLA